MVPTTLLAIMSTNGPTLNTNNIMVNNRVGTYAPPLELIIEAELIYLYEG